MIGSLLSELSESRLVPSVRSLINREAEEVAELVHMHLCALRILLTSDDTSPWAYGYCRDTSRPNDFKNWKVDGTDLYALMHALVDNSVPVKRPEFRKRLSLDAPGIHHWLHRSGAHDMTETETRRLFTRLDTLLSVTDPSLRAIRRLVLDWHRISHHDRSLAVTRLLQKFRSLASKAEIVGQLERLARLQKLELHDVCDPESDDCAARTDETATSGSTVAANIAVVPGTLGAGFDPDGHRGVYEKRPVLLRRTSPNK
jgi:hypothetical protein